MGSCASKDGVLHVPSPSAERQNKNPLKASHAAEAARHGGASRLSDTATHTIGSFSYATGDEEEGCSQADDSSEGSLDLDTDEDSRRSSTLLRRANSDQAVPRRTLSRRSSSSFAYGDFKSEGHIDHWSHPRTAFAHLKKCEVADGVFVYNDFRVVDELDDTDSSYELQRASTPGFASSLLTREPSSRKRPSSPGMEAATFASRLASSRAGSATSLVLPSGTISVTSVTNQRAREHMQMEEAKTLRARGHNSIHSFVVKPHVGHSANVKWVAIAPGEKEFISFTKNDFVVTLKSAITGMGVTSFSGHQEQLLSATFSPDGKYLATSSRDKSMILWDVVTAKPILQFDHAMVVISCAFSRDSRFVVTGCQDRVCRVWEAKKGKETTFFSEHSGPIVCMSFSLDDCYVASGSADKTVRVWSALTGKSRYTLKGHRGVVISCVFTNCGTRIASNCDQLVNIWSAESGALMRSINIQQFGGGLREKRWTWTTLTTAPGLYHKFIVVASNNRFVYVIDIESGEEVVSYYCKAAVYAISAGNVNTVVFGDFYGNVYLAEIR